jgi:hypothetical protein
MTMQSIIAGSPAALGASLEDFPDMLARMPLPYAQFSRR